MHVGELDPQLVPRHRRGFGRASQRLDEACRGLSLPDAYPAKT
jgi:hypothetical protein